MEIYTAKKETSASKKVVLDDMLLTKDMPTAAGSKMLKGYMSLLDAEVISRMENAGYGIAGKTDVGEFAIDLLGETSANGAITVDGKIQNASSLALENGDVDAAVCLDVNGSVRRAAAQSGLVSIKPTYGTVSRYGLVPVACSGETVSVMAKTAKECADLLFAISGHDAKDGTSLSDEKCESAKQINPIKKVAIIENLTPDGCKAMENAKAAFEAQGIEVTKISSDVLFAARAAWNILMSAELCNNVSRYDGVKYGYRTPNYKNIDELYTNSRTEAFGELLKTAILFGSDTLSTDNYMKVYDKALRIRRVVCEEFDKLFNEYDAVLMGVCSTLAYTEADLSDKYKVYKENVYTAPASISGLPAVVAGKVQLIGRSFSDASLLETAKILTKEGK